MNYLLQLIVSTIRANERFLAKVMRMYLEERLRLNPAH